MKQLFLLLSFVLVTFGLFAQPEPATLQGQVFLEGNRPAEGASVSLHAAKDSTLAKTAMADKNGAFRFSAVAGGSYFLRVSFSGYATHSGSAFVFQSPLQLPGIVLAPATGDLNNITVRAQKPLIEQKFDKLIFNVAGNITAAGNNALELLAKAPGVSVDGEGAVSLGGRPGVLILIDGKRSYLSGADLAAYLRGLPASAIERIDLISNPSAQYEAAGTSGIIDIRLKKDEKLGYNGTLNLAYLKGTGSSGNGSLNFNYRNRNLNVYGTFSKTYDDVEGRQETERRFFLEYFSLQHE